MQRVLLICLILVCNICPNAQPPQQQTPEEHTAALKASLLLTDVQTKKVEVIFVAQAKSSDSLLKAANGDFNILRDKMIPLNNRVNTKIKAVLTAQQVIIFQKQIDAQYEHMRQMMQQGMGKNSSPPTQKQ